MKYIQKHLSKILAVACLQFFVLPCIAEETQEHKHTESKQNEASSTMGSSDNKNHNAKQTRRDAEMKEHMSEMKEENIKKMKKKHMKMHKEMHEKMKDDDMEKMKKNKKMEKHHDTTSKDKDAENK